MQPQFSKILASASKTANKNQLRLSGKVAVENANSVKILSVVATANCSTSEVFTGEVRYGGRVDFAVIYLGSESENKRASASVDFSDKVENGLIKSGSNAHLSCVVLDCEIDEITQSEIMVSAIIEITAVLESEAEITALTDAPDLCCHTKTVSYDKKQLCSKAVGSADSESVNTDFVEILCAEHQAIVLETSVGVDYLKLSGKVYTRIVGRRADGLLGEKELSTPFSEEITAVGAVTGDIARVKVSVSASENLSETEQGVIVSYEYALGYDYCVYASTSAQIVTDLFSPQNKLEITRTTNEVCYHRVPVSCGERVEGIITLDDEMPVADNILCATGVKIAVTNLIAGNGEVTAEGVVSGNVIYYSGESGGEYSVAIELPFSLPIRCSEVKASDEIICDSVVKSVSARLRRGNEIDARVEIELCLTAFARDSITVVSEVREGEAIALPSGAFSIYIANPGESIWDCCKALCVTPEVITSQNPNLPTTLVGGEKIVIYRQKFN